MALFNAAKPNEAALTSHIRLAILNEKATAPAMESVKLAAAAGNAVVSALPRSSSHLATAETCGQHQTTRRLTKCSLFPAERTGCPPRMARQRHIPGL